MSLRSRGYIVEATYSRDVDLRKIAERFYKDLFEYLKKNDERLGDVLHKTGDGGFAAMSTEFSDDENAPRCVVRFTPGGNKFIGGVGSAGGVQVIVLPIMIGPNDPRFLATRMKREIVVHEVIHLLDPGHKKTIGKGSGFSARTMDAGDMSGYYNHPSEWNAYWQEGASTFERLLANPTFAKGSDASGVFFGDGSLSGLMKNLDKFWDKGFLKAMTKETRRKFDKRLAALWNEARKRGDL